MVLLVFLFGPVFSQDARKIIDSLKLQLNKKPTNTEKVEILSNLSWYYNAIHVDSTLYYGNEGLKLANELKDMLLIAQAYSDLGVGYFVKGDLDRSLEFYQKSLALRIKEKNKERIASLELKIGNIYYKKAQIDKAMSSFLSALKFYEAQKDLAVTASLEHNIAVLYTYLKNYPKALQFLESSLAYFEKNANHFEIANIEIALGNVYYSTKSYEKAINHFKKAADAAAKSQNFTALASAYNNLSTIYLDIKNYNLAMRYSERALAIRKEKRMDADVLSSQLTIATILNKTGKYTEAAKQLKDNLMAYQDMGNHEKLSLIYYELIRSYNGLNNSDSVSRYLELFNEHQAEILNAEVIKTSSELEAKYQSEKKEKEILLQRAEIAERNLALEKKNEIIYLVIVFAVIVILLGYILYSRQRSVLREAQLKEAQLEVESQNKLKEQRLRISRDLHDNIGAQLAFIISSLDNLKYSFSMQEQLLGKVSGISSFTRETITELRDTIWAMNKDELLLSDLESRIRNFINTAKNANHNIDFSFDVASEISKDIRIPSVKGVNIYRIIQEGVHNALKHSGASHIWVRIGGTDSLKITVEDNGKGFDTSAASSGNGLANLKNRIADCNGVLDISSTQNGTVLSVVVDLHES